MTDDGRRYPVQVTTSEVYLVWVEAEDAEDAVQRCKDDPEIHELLRDQQAHDYFTDVEPLEPWQYDGGIYQVKQGPWARCNQCEARPLSFDRMNHTPTCPRQVRADSARLVHTMSSLPVAMTYAARALRQGR